MSNLWFYQDPIDRLHQEGLQMTRRRYGPPSDKPDYRHVEQSAQRRLLTLLGEMNLRSNPTVNNAPFDLWVEGVKVELKAARWHNWKSGGRYQAAIRNYEADILIFDCINGTDHWHIIPMADIQPRTSLAVWSYDPEQSSGQWQPYLEQWDYLHQAVEVANHNWQPPLF